MESIPAMSSNMNFEESLKRMSDAIYELVLRVGRFEDFISNETFTIEQEISSKVKTTLQEQYPDYRILEPLKMFPEMEHFYVPNGCSTITQFDGLFIVTNDPTYDLPEHDYDAEKPEGVKTYFVIVEGKHCLTSKQCRFKLEQVVKIQAAFELAREIKAGNADEKSVTPSFLARMNQFRFHEFEKEVHLFIGGPLLKSDTLVWLKGIGHQLLHDPKPFMISQSRTIPQMYPIRTSIVYPQGHRYTAADVENDYELK